MSKHFIYSLIFLGIIAAVNFDVLSHFSFGKPKAVQTRLTKNGLVVTKQAPAVLPPTELADFAAGCFWGVEEEFRKLPGVMATAVGFEGGHKKNPTYEEVCDDNTGHAETVSVEYDPKKVSYEKLLELFWSLHDPTTLNRQGPDTGTQYRSVIFTRSKSQEDLAKLTRTRLQNSGELSKPIVTEIVPATTFTKADEHHQQYVEKGGHAACHFRIKK